MVDYAEWARTSTAPDGVVLYASVAPAGVILPRPAILGREVTPPPGYVQTLSERFRTWMGWRTDGTT